MRNATKTFSVILTVPLLVLKYMMDTAKKRARELGGAQDEKWLSRVLTTRVLSGLELVEAGKVRFDRESGRYYVASSRPKGGPKLVPSEYAVYDGRCDCPDHRHGKLGDWANAAPGGHCKHLAAVEYTQHIEHCMAKLEELSSRVTVSPVDPDAEVDFTYSQLPESELAALSH